VPLERKTELFQERPGEFEALEKLLEADKTLARLGLVGVTGMGGIGKTQLAVELAHRLHQQNKFPDGIYWLVATGQLDEWNLRLAALAETIEYRPVEDDPGHPENPQRRARYLARYLAHTADALLVLDNVDDPALVPKFLHELTGEEASCAILYTSRDKSAVPGVQLHRVERLAIEAALSLLLETTRPDLLQPAMQNNSAPEAQAARELCQWAGYLPLALTHLRAELARNPRLAVARLLDQPRLRGASLLEKKERGDPEEAKLFATFELSYDKISTPQARDLFLTACCFPPAALLPLWLVGVATGLGESADPFEPLADSLAELQQLNLLDELADDFTRLHPLVAQFGVEKLAAFAKLPANAAGRIANAFDELLADALPPHLAGLETLRWWHQPLTEQEKWFGKVLAEVGNRPNLAQAAAKAAEGLAYALQETKDWPTAVVIWNRVLELDPTFAGAFNNRGLAYRALKQYERAIADYDQGITLDPTLAYAFINRGLAYDDLKQYERAIADYDQALALDPTFATAFYIRGLAYRALKQYEQAIADYDQAIALDPTFAGAFNNRGLAYANLKQYEQAIADYDQALALDPTFATAFFGRGNAYYNLKQHERAIADYDQAIALDPTAAFAFYNRAATYEKVGELAAARRDFSRAMALGDPDAETRLKALDNSLKKSTSKPWWQKFFR
jgi:tetratricopeptide (TPR) repeat protein